MIGASNSLPHSRGVLILIVFHHALPSSMGQVALYLVNCCWTAFHWASDSSGRYFASGTRLIR